MVGQRVVVQSVGYGYTQIHNMSLVFICTQQTHVVGLRVAVQSVGYGYAKESTGIHRYLAFICTWQTCMAGLKIVVQ
jgi:hypothetical protein